MAREIRKVDTIPAWTDTSRMPRQTRDLFLGVRKGGSAIGLDGEVTMQQTIIDKL